MTRLATAIASLLLLGGAGLAQVREIRYPQLAAAARAQGDVRLRSGAGGVVPISGHPLLIQAAIVGMKALGTRSEHSELEVMVAVKRGDAFDRLILRALEFKTEKTIKERTCVDTEPPPENRIDSTRAPIEVWGYRRNPCHALVSFGVATS